MKLAIVTGTTRDGRVTPKLAKWVEAATRAKTDDVVLYDLESYGIRLLEQAPWEPSRELTEGEQRWLDDLATADAVVFVTAEYNHSVPAGLKNAIDITGGQLRRKAVGIVSHGVVGGARSSEILRIVLGSKIGAAVVPDAVTFHGNVGTLIDDNGVLAEDTSHNAAALDAHLDEVLWYAEKLA